MAATITDTAETLLRLVQSVPSPKAEPIKLWLAKVGYERMQIAETDDATGMNENKVAATKGGAIARQARQALEAKTGKPVVTGENFLPPGKGSQPKKVK